MAKFEKGTVVQLKSGGPALTAGDTHSGAVECFWFDGKDPRKNYFDEDLLVAVDLSVL